MKKNHSLSVVLAVHNEAANLARCLESVAKLADEIVLVDGESSDETVAIGRRFGVHLIETTNKANFHINKQLGLDAARGELILQLDADEVVDPDLTQFLQRLKTSTNLKTAPAAWWLRRKNFFLNRWLSKGGQYPDPVIRLFQRGQARLPMKDVHEQMVVEGRIETAPGHLLHYSNPTLATYLRKMETYSSFRAEQLIETDWQPSLGQAINYFLIKPLRSWSALYLRHRGYVDGWAGFIFAYLSALHHPLVYLKVLEKTHLS